MAANMEMIWVWREAKYFCEWGWTGDQKNCATGKSVWRSQEFFALRRGTGETVRRAQSVHPLNASSVPSLSVTDAINADTAIGSCRRLGYSTLSPWLVR
jgi:hypothetical protein